ncbi:MAG: ThuA domain-containing protein [Thermoguttaceae bacterium]|jgi:type 1 glutamine amidotransferase
MHSLLIALGTAAAVLSATPAAKTSAPVRVLLVTGVDHPAHSWRETAPALRGLLEKDRQCAVTIAEDPDALAAPSTLGYDLLLLHFKNYKPLEHEALARENLVNFVKQGKGLAVVHFASGAFENWPEFANLAGKVWDRKTSHDPRGPFTVRITGAQHPITRGMQDFAADDELYTCLIGDRAVDLLAVARSKVTKQDHPMAFAFSYGKGRVFHTPLGHDVKAIEMPGVSALIRRGCLWAAGREP